MLYRETGQFRTSYAADQALFPILLDRIGMAVILLVAFVVIPLVGSPFFLNTIMIPFLVFATLFSYFGLARRKWQQGENND